MLMSIVVYMYTVIAFNFFRKFYSKEEEGELEENCKDLATVMKYFLIILVSLYKLNCFFHLK